MSGCKDGFPIFHLSLSDAGHSGHWVFDMCAVVCHSLVYSQGSSENRAQNLWLLVASGSCHKLNAENIYIHITVRIQLH